MFFRKKENEEYLYELQLFLDKAEKIKDDSIRKEIIIQMLKCNDALNKICENKLMDFYNKGYEKWKSEHNKI